MNTQQAADAVAEFLRTNGPSTKLAITEATSVKGLALTNALKKLTKDNFLHEEGEGEEMLYSEKTIVNEDGQLIEETETDDAPSKKGRNNQKFKFNGEEYGKGRLVLAVVRQYVEDHKPTLKQLKEAFPDELLKRFGVWQEEDKANEISGARPRYFISEADQIRVKGKVIVVCSQWTSENIQGFLSLAKKLYKIR
jgi:hypothetical protein